MILEGLTTTRNADGVINVAPLGPIVSPDFARLTFRPFPGSRSFGNLHRTGCGVFHVVDDVLLLVQTALDLPHSPPPTMPATVIDGEILVDCCRWYEFRIDRIDETGERPVFDAAVVGSGRRRDSFGFNRARHAVIEAVIAASRLEYLPAQTIADELRRSQSPVDKTGGPREREALDLISAFARERSPEVARLLP